MFSYLFSLLCPLLFTAQNTFPHAQPTIVNIFYFIFTGWSEDDDNIITENKVFFRTQTNDSSSVDVEDSLNNEPGNVNIYVNAVLFFTIVQFFDVLFLYSI